MLTSSRCSSGPKAHLEIARQRGERADTDRLPRNPCRGSPQYAEQLVSRREHCVRVVEGDAAGLGQHQLFPLARKQAMADLVLELADLHRQ